jgi:MinD-like ATPase involved in chromosome partitioning or flagellar assembly
MKTIIFYSGKGGVGKSTITGLVAVELSRKGNRVAILDSDINTPSMSILFPKDKVKNLHVFSYGYKTSQTTYYSSTTVEQILNSFASEIKTGEFDYLLIDTPPSVTSIHEKLFKIFNISSAVIISQPTELSKNDVRKTINMFYDKKVPIIGVVYNMLNKAFSKVDTALNLDILAEINLDEKLNLAIENKKFLQYKNLKLKSLISKIIKSKNVDWKEYEQSIVFSDLTEEEVKEMIFSQGISKGLHYYNLSTWDYIRGKLQDQEYVTRDKFLTINDVERIKRVLDAFSKTNKALFTITNNPNTRIRTFPGEVSSASLLLGEKSYYGVPRIKYQTDQGELVLFPHEIAPFNIDEFQYNEFVLYPNTDVQRYLPKAWVMEQIYKIYGSSVGCPNDWKEKYKELGLI